MDYIDKLNEVYTRLQTLDIRPTQTNMEKLLQCLYDMKDIAKELSKEEEADAGDENGTQVDPG